MICTDACGASTRLVLDGRRGGGRGGAELGPTVLDGGPPEGRALREELFGPVLSVLRAPDLNAAIEWANASRYGNAAVIFTADGGAARAFRTRIAAGMVGVLVGYQQVRHRLGVKPVAPHVLLDPIGALTANAGIDQGDGAIAVHCVDGAVTGMGEVEPVRAAAD